MYHKEASDRHLLASQDSYTSITPICGTMCIDSHNVSNLDKSAKLLVMGNVTACLIYTWV